MPYSTRRKKSADFCQYHRGKEYCAAKQGCGQWDREKEWVTADIAAEILSRSEENTMMADSLNDIANQFTLAGNYNAC